MAEVEPPTSDGPPDGDKGRDAVRFRVFGIGGLDEEEVKKHFEKYGVVQGLDIGRDPFTNESIGSGSLRLSPGDKGAEERLQADEHEVDGKSLTLGDDYERKIFVGGFKDAEPDDVRDYFATFGPLEEFDVAFREKGGRPRGYAFIRFAKQQDVDKVLENRTHSVKGKTVSVKKAEARPMTPKAKPKAVAGGQAKARPMSRSRSPRGKRTVRTSTNKGGLQVAPGYEYRDGIGARPSHGYTQPPHHGAGPGYPPQHAPPGYAYGYGPPGPPGAVHIGYGPPPPGYAAYGSQPGYPPPGSSAPPPGYVAVPAPSGYSAAPAGYAPAPAPAYVPAAYGAPVPAQPAYGAPPPVSAYAAPPPAYGAPPPGAYAHAYSAYGPPPGH